MRVTHRESYASLQLLQESDSLSPEAWKTSLDSCLEKPTHLVVSCAGIDTLSENALENLHFLQQQTRGAQKGFFLVWVSEALKKNLDASRFGKYLGIEADLFAALEKFETDKSPMSQMYFIKSFVNATLRALFVQAELQCQRSNVYALTPEARKELRGEVSAFVHVKSRHASYDVFVTFPASTFFKVMEKIYGEAFTEITPFLRAQAPLFLSGIINQAKQALNAKGVQVTPEVPVLLLTREPPKEIAIQDGKTLVVPFQCEAGEFFIEAWFPEKFELSQLKR